MLEQDARGSSGISITGGLEEWVRDTSVFRAQKMNMFLETFKFCEGQTKGSFARYPE